MHCRGDRVHHPQHGLGHIIDVAAGVVYLVKYYGVGIEVAFAGEFENCTVPGGRRPDG